MTAAKQPTKGTMKPAANTFSPWLVKQRPAGDWVVDQLNRTTGQTRRIGPFKTEAEARGVHQDLTVKKPTP